MDGAYRVDSTFPGAMEMGQEPLPPVPPELDLDLDLNVDFDRLPEIEVPAEEPALPIPPKEEPAPSASSHAPGPRRPFAWWSALAGVISLLSIALLAVPFAMVRLSEMSREVSRLSDRVDQGDTENRTLHEKLAYEAMEAVAQHLADTDRRIERVRGALDECNRDREGHVAPPVAQKTAPQPTAPAQPAAPAPGPPPAVTAPPAQAPAPLVVPPKEPGPLVGVSKIETPEAIRPASAVKGQKAPPAKSNEAKAERPVDDGRIVLPTELYNEDE